MSVYLRSTTDSQLNHVQETLEAIGYDPLAIVCDYDFAAPGQENSRARVDMVAFSDSVRHDLRTSCVAVQRVTPQTRVRTELEILSYLATPVAIFLRPNGVEIWSATRKTNQQPHHRRLPYNRLTQYFIENAREFHPETLSVAKTQGNQLSFFDLDHQLLDFAFEATQDLLVEKFESALNEARESLNESKQQLTAELTKMALQILAATILEDKQLLGTERSESVGALMRRAEEQYSQYFDAAMLDQIGRTTAQITFDALRYNITFRSFTNEMLGHFYENALVNEDVRRQLGVYYTPQTVAKRILARLPIEDIPPSDRVVFDGSSGSGNFLLAGFDRLANLLPAGWDRERRHRYLVQRIYGIDVDQFATQVAGLSLFFTDLPKDRTWNVKTVDFLNSEQTWVSKAPTILVGNPPFKEQRSQQGRRFQQATLFLNKYLDMLVPGGLLGVVLPETLLENSSCREVRQRLLEECEILELWHLPEGIFPMSQVATVTVLAKKLVAKQNNTDMPVRVEKVSVLPHEKKSFLSGERPRFSYVIPSTQPWIEAQGGRVASSHLEKQIWNEIRIPKRLRDVAEVRNGIIPGRDQRTTHIHDVRRGADWKPWLGSTTRLEPYALRPGPQNYIKYPGDLHRPRLDLDPVFVSPNSKVLVNSARAPGNPWRIYAAIDHVGYFPSQGFYCIMLTDQSATWEELVAVLNSSLANAWVDSHNRRRWIGEDTLRDMPFPLFTESERDSVVSRVKEIMALKQCALEDPSDQRLEAKTIREMVLAMDDVVCTAFGVDKSGRDALQEYFAGYRRPGFEWTTAEPPDVEPTVTSKGRTWTVTGQVIQTEAEIGTLTLWVRGYQNDEPFCVPIPETMPGWALRPEAGFEAEIPWSSRHAEELPVSALTNFRPLDFSYAKPEDLEELLENPENLDSLYGV